MKIELPDALPQWAQEQAELNGYPDAGAYVAQVLLAQQRALEASLQETGKAAG